MTIQRINPGPRMSGAVVHGNTVYLAGQVAQNAAGQSVGEQTKDILSIIDGLLADAGTDKTKLLMVNIWLTDMSTFAEMNAVWDIRGCPRQHAGPRDGRVQARRTAIQGRNRRHRGEIGPTDKETGPAGPVSRVRRSGAPLTGRRGASRHCRDTSRSPGCRI